MNLLTRLFQLSKELKFSGLENKTPHYFNKNH